MGRRDENQFLHYYNGTQTDETGLRIEYETQVLSVFHNRWLVHKSNTFQRVLIVDYLSNDLILKIIQFFEQKSKT